MYDIEIYTDKKGYSNIIELIQDLDSKASTNKNSRIRVTKIREYLRILREYGTRAGQPYIKHITNTELWELRPTRDRVFFAHLQGDTFILLHHFVKKTQKTPKKEIDRAIGNLEDLKQRSN